MTTVDLNADVGESFGRWRLGDDEALLDVITSANVACGFHAGDPTTLRRTCETAVARGVAIGAQVGYRDLAGFGRRYIAVSRRDLTADVLYQLGALDGLARVAGSAVSYLKPHGALYHAASTDHEQGGALIDALLAWDRPLAVLGLAGSAFLRRAEEAGLTVVREAFADRGYLADGGLVPRSGLGALITDPDEVAARVVDMVSSGHVAAADGTRVPIAADSICLHGDTPGAATLAVRVRAALEDAGVGVASFAS